MSEKDEKKGKELFSITTENVWKLTTVVLAIVVIAVIAGAFMVVSKRGSSLYFGKDKRINELDAFTIKGSKEEEEMAKELSDGKWAHKK